MAAKRAIFISKISGKTFDQVMAERNEGFAHCQGLGYFVMDSLFTEEPYTGKRLVDRGIVNRDLFLFAKTIERMSMCNAVHFSDDCKDNASTAKLMDIAEQFGLEMI